MIRFNTKTAVTKFTSTRPLNSKDVRFTVADTHISLDFRQPADLPYDLFYVIGTFESDDEDSGTIDFEAQSICAIDNKRQRPEVDDLLLIARHAMNQLNTAFHQEAARQGIGFTETLFRFTEKFTESDLRESVSKLLSHQFPSGT